MKVTLTIPSFKRVIINAVISCVTGYVAFGLMLFVLQKDIIFQPTAISADYSYGFSLPYEELQIERGDKVTLSGVYFPSENATATTIFFGGNAGHAGYYEDFARELIGLGQRVYIFDYRGYGKSSGDQDFDLMLSDTLAIHDFVKARHQRQDLHLIGYSMGSAMASNIAAQRDVTSLTMFAPFHSMDDLASRRYVQYPDFILKFPFDNAAALQKVDEPIQIIHGNADRVVPVESGLALKPHLKEGDSFTELGGVRHYGILAADGVALILAETFGRKDGSR